MLDGMRVDGELTGRLGRDLLDLVDLVGLLRALVRRRVVDVRRGRCGRRVGDAGQPGSRLDDRLRSVRRGRGGGRMVFNDGTCGRMLDRGRLNRRKRRSQGMCEARERGGPNVA